jgi:transposase
MTKDTYESHCKHLKGRLKAALTLVPTEKNGIRLRKRYIKHQGNLLLFLEDHRIPPTNNSSEQALRPSVIFRKLTNGFRSTWGRDFYASVRSIIHTGQRNGLSVYEALSKALDSPESFLLAIT